MHQNYTDLKDFSNVGHKLGVFLLLIVLGSFRKLCVIIGLSFGLFGVKEINEEEKVALLHHYDKSICVELKKIGRTQIILIR